MKSAMIVPMEAGGRILGAITLVSCNPDRLFDEVDLGLATDLARRAALAVDNAQLHQRTLQAVRVRDEFLATVSHELRTPLNAVLGWVGLLRSGALDEDEAGRALETIERNARAQAKLIEDLLDVSRIISGKLKLTTHPVDLMEIVAIVIDGSRPGALVKEVSLELGLCALSADERTVIGDPQRLQQVVWNLVSNAIKFTPKGGRIQIEVSREDEQLSLRVHDSGPGIAADFLPFVFERFRQADGSTSRHYGGLGLGLAIVRHLTELHGGTVDVASPGKLGGASFTVHLVQAKGSSLNEPVKVAEKEPRGEVKRPGKLNGIRVVLVDDDDDGRHALAALLRHMGAQVREAESAASALEHIEAGPADVLLSDIGMPGDDGYFLMARLREWEQREGRLLPAAAVTAYSREIDRRLTREAGFQGHLAKPVDPGTLAAMVLELAGR
jgi:signal transduction histidine kinase/CheY-like chemotaxis protein